MSPTISACPTVRSTRSLARRPPNRLVSPWTSSSVCPSIAAAKYRAGSSGASRPCTAHRARALFVPPGRRAMPDPLDPEELRAVDAWWRAANYLTVGQIYLHQNPLLREPLRPEHVKPRLLGHWGTSPGISLVYAHLTRLVRQRDTEAILLVGPGHGGPAVNANVWLEGTWSEVYPAVTRDSEGMRRLFRQFSTPYGVPSHVSPPTPGSIHEGGELGYVLTHAFGAAFDNPELLAVAIVGDGEAETGPLEGSWKGISFLNAARDGAVLPVLHLNGYKIASPTVLGRKPDEEVRALFSGHGYEPRFVEGDQPARVHQDFAAALEWARERILEYQGEARGGRLRERPRWPLIVLRTPKGWTGPRELDGVRIEGTFRSHQVPLSKVREDPRQLEMLEQWMRSYRPEELFDERGRPAPRITALAPRGDRRLGANPHANGGLLLRPLELPDFTRYALEVTAPGVVRAESTRQLGFLLRDVYRQNPRTFRLFFTYEAFALIVASMATQHAKWLEMCETLPWRKPVASLNVLLTSTCWRNDHNGFSHQGPGFLDTVISKKGTVARAYLPPDANCLLSVVAVSLRTRNYVNLIVIDKQPELQWLDMDAARDHCSRGASVWKWACNEGPEGEPDVVLACAGDTPTLETLAAARFLRENAPDLRVRVVNVVDLMTLFSPEEHPHGMREEAFVELFTSDVDVVFAFHGYPTLIHGSLHGRPNPSRFHVRGYREEGTTTTPFDMTVLNQISRFHLAAEALKRARRKPSNAAAVIEECHRALDRHRQYVEEHMEDLPEIRGWTWT